MIFSRRNLLTGAALCAAAPSLWAAGDAVTDVLNRTVTLPAHPKRIVVADYLANFVLTAGPESLAKVCAVAADHWETARTGEYQVFTDAYPVLKTLPSVGGYHDNLLNTEKILALKPDVLLTSITKFRDNAQRMALLEKAGIAVVVIDYHAMTAENHTRSTYLIGRITDTDDRALSLVREMTMGTDMLQSRLADIPENEKHRPVYVELGNLGVAAVGNSYNKTILWGAMLASVAAGNIAADNPAPWGALTREYVIRKNPEVIFVAGSLWTGGAADQMKMGFMVSEADARRRLSEFMKRPAWQMLSAVRHHRVYGVDHGSLRSIIDWHLTHFLAKACYPAYFKDADPQADLLRTYRRYLPNLNPEGTFVLEAT